MLKFLIIVLSIFFLIRIFARMFVVSTFNSLNKKVADEMKRKQEQSTPQKPEGHISIDNEVKKKNNNNNNDSDYVDYEEVN